MNDKKTLALVAIGFLLGICVCWLWTRNERGQIAEIKADINRIESNQSAVIKRLGGVENGLETVSGRVGKISDGIGAVSNKIGTVADRIGAVEKRFDNIQNGVGRSSELIKESIRIIDELRKEDKKVKN
jgi:archaellum component FlaC